MIPMPRVPNRALACGLAMTVCAATAHAQDAVQPTLFEPLAAFESPDISESSGVAVSRRHPGLLWTHNDSGHDPILYAVDLKGRQVGRFTVTGAKAVDWEDIALGRCPGTDETCLYVADTGDNGERRNHVSLYIVREPDDVDGERTVGARRIRLSYPDGPRDVEALAVMPSGDVLLISRGRRRPIVALRLPRDALLGTAAEAVPWFDLGIEAQSMIGRLVTGAAVSADGSTLAVRTYTELYLFSLTERPEGAQLVGKCWLGLKEPQGEAVDFLDDTTLVFTSEAARGRRGGISRVQCPGYPRE